MGEVLQTNNHATDGSPMDRARPAGEFQMVNVMAETSLARAMPARRKFNPAYEVADALRAIAANDPRVNWPGSDMPLCNLTVVDQRLFEGLVRIKIAGDVNVPKFRDGEEIEFGPAMEPADKIIEGKFYLLQLHDGRAMLRRAFVDPLNAGCLLLRCGNRRKYPSDQRIFRSDVARLMPAKYRWVPVDDQTA